jgi:hypothetical protein
MDYSDFKIKNTKEYIFIKLKKIILPLSIKDSSYGNTTTFMALPISLGRCSIHLTIDSGDSANDHL